MRRAFLAVRPPDAVLDALEDVGSDPVWPPHRLTSRDLMHVTVAFLGRVDDAGALISVLHGVARDVARAGAAGAGAPAPLRFRGLGAFPSTRRAQVCWAGVDDTRFLAGLHSMVATRAAGLVEHHADRPYRPHLTLVRFRRPADIRPEIDVMRGEPIGPRWSPSEAILFESDMRSGGPRHRAVVRFMLGAVGA